MKENIQKENIDKAKEYYEGPQFIEKDEILYRGGFVENIKDIELVKKNTLLQMDEPRFFSRYIKTADHYMQDGVQNFDGTGFIITLKVIDKIFLAKNSTKYIINYKNDDNYDYSSIYGMIAQEFQRKYCVDIINMIDFNHEFSDRKFDGIYGEFGDQILLKYPHKFLSIIHTELFPISPRALNNMLMKNKYNLEKIDELQNIIERNKEESINNLIKASKLEDKIKKIREMTVIKRYIRKLLFQDIIDEP